MTNILNKIIMKRIALILLIALPFFSSAQDIFVTDDGAMLKIQIGSVIKDYPKDDISLSANGTRLIISTTNGIIISADFSQYLAPVAGTADALRSLISAIISTPPITIASIARDMTTVEYRAQANGTGYSNNDAITRYEVVNVTDPAAFVAVIWYNEMTGLVIAEPPVADIQTMNDNIRSNLAVNTTNTGIVASAVTGTEMQVDIVGVLQGTVLTFAPLTAPGVTSSTLTPESLYATWQVDVTTIDTNIDVIAEGSLDVGTFAAMASLDPTVTFPFRITANGTYLLPVIGRTEAQRFNFLAEAGGTAAVVIVQLLLGN